MRRFVILSALSALAFCAGCASPAPRGSAVGDYLGGRWAASAFDVEHAAAAFAEAQARAPDSEEILRDAFFFKLAAGDIEGVTPFAEALAAKNDPRDDGLSKVVLAARAVKEGRFAEARARLAGGVEAKYLVPTARLIKVWASAALDGPDTAAKLLNEPSTDEFRGFYPLHEALLAEQAGRLEDARNAHQVGVMASGGRVERAAYGAFLERAGDEAETRRYYALLANDPGVGRELARRGLARLAAGRASREFSATTPAEGAAIAFYGLGAAILDETTNQRAAARRAGYRVGAANYNMPLIFFQLALYLDPDLDDARLLKGSLFNAYGEHEKTIAALERIRPNSAYFGQSRTEIAGALNALDRADEAAGVLKAAILQDRGNLEVRLALANLYAARGRHRDAVRALDGLIERLPDPPYDDSWRYFVARAASLLELDAWPRAEADLERAVAIAPEEPTALNYLGYSWAERGENLDKAFAMIEKAVALRPESGAIIDSLGWAHFQLDRFDLAVVQLERAASLEPADPTITEHLGDVYWRLGRTLEARYQWRRVLELDPGDKIEARAQEKLAQGLPDAAE